MEAIPQGDVLGQQTFPFVDRASLEPGVKYDTVLARLNDMYKPFFVPVRASNIGAYFSCPRRYLYRSRLKLFPTQTFISPALETGTYFHRFMELPYREWVIVGQEYQKSVDNIVYQIEREGDLDGRLDKALRDTSQAYEKAHVMAEIMNRKVSLPMGSRVITVEQEVEAHIKLPIDPKHPEYVLVQGRIDRIEETKDGEFWIVDWKTTSFTPEAVVAGYAYSDACLLYRLLGARWLESQGLDPKKLTGFKLNVIAKPSIKFCPNGKDSNKDGLYESPWRAYIARCTEWYEEQEKKGKQVFTQYSIRWVNSSILPDEFLYKLKRMAFLGSTRETLTKEGLGLHYPRNHHSCADSYGRTCPYLDLCTYNYALWPSLLAQRFTVRPEGK